MLLAFATASADAPGSEVDWVTGVGSALDAAKESSRPVFVDLWAVWCEPCKHMEETTYRDPRVLESMKRFVPLKVDADANTVFMDRYEIEGLPTTLFLDGEGREITREMSMLEADRLLEIMAEVEKGFPAYLADVARSDDPAALRAAAAYLLGLDNPDGAAELLRGALKIVKKSDPGETELLELEIAEATLAGERASSAAKTLRRLSESGDPEIRGRALVGLVRAERERGRDDKAEEALAVLREEFPDKVSEVTGP